MKEVKWIVAVFGVVLMWCGFAFGAPPEIPSNPFPVDGEVDVTQTVDLSWDCSDFDGDDLVYEIWMRRIPEGWLYSLDWLDLFQANQDPIQETNFTLANLMTDTSYVWQVRAIEDKDDPEKTWGPRWTFTTGDFVGITAIAPDPARAGRPIRIHGYGFLSGAPKFVAVGDKKFRYRKSDRIQKWSDSEIWLLLPGYKAWEKGDVEQKDVRVKVKKDDGPQIATYEDLVIYKKYCPEGDLCP